MSGSPFSTGSETFPESVVVGDFNGDGFPDIATANPGGNSVTVLLGNGAGVFGPAPGSPFTLGTSPRYLAVGDFNGDGIQDLVTANQSGNNVTVLLGNGAGGFTAASAFQFAWWARSRLPWRWATSPNGDGFRGHCRTANQSDNTVTVLLGDGSGGFTRGHGQPIYGGNGSDYPGGGGLQRGWQARSCNGEPEHQRTLRCCWGNGIGRVHGYPRSAVGAGVFLRPWRSATSTGTAFRTW